MIRGLPWAGALDEVAFLGRLYDLNALRSFDTRFKTAGRDIWQHRVNDLDDWEDDWVLHDPRFNILGGELRTSSRSCAKRSTHACAEATAPCA